MPKVAGLIGPTLSFYEIQFYINMNGNHSDLSLDIILYQEALLVAAMDLPK